jgi:hypothetical protein
MGTNLPTYARVSFPPGVDETRISIVEDDTVVAETVLRPAGQYRPGPSNWDHQVNLLHYARTSPWRPDQLGGFTATVKVIFRADD